MFVMETSNAWNRITSYNVCYTKLLREKAVALAPNVADIKLNLADAYIKAGRMGDAKSIVEALSGSVPKNTPAAARLAELASKL